MQGSRIENLKKALIEFMKVLPQNSYFNISKSVFLYLFYSLVSYGSSYDSMFSKS